MIEEKKLTLENAILLLKHAGFWNALKDMPIHEFGKSSLENRFEKMIVEEEKKNEEKNEKLLVDLCECYLLLSNGLALTNIVSIIVPCLLKAALNKEENEEAQKEVEMALLALKNLGMWKHVEQELYLDKTIEIIKYHQEHYNLTRLAYQPAWQFLIFRFCKDKSLEELIANELHFAREAIKE
eukprot:MONOS_6417.1-p1 / transcript=MONOS_6417.1 / gene=MONOS_6417 / organism=Monocercomonoides_exilis_PA203 / gene_product=unspecified product / transcript_product=unspecified product / location=Mono_scaffold00202:8837-9448(-) / protein_length=183 / sequence_SO=supercontig / SO=protein_coding / is_pseudo=false